MAFPDHRNKLLFQQRWPVLSCDNLILLTSFSVDNVLVNFSIIQLISIVEGTSERTTTFPRLSTPYHPRETGFRLLQPSWRNLQPSALGALTALQYAHLPETTDATPPAMTVDIARVLATGKTQTVKGAGLEIVVIREGIEMAVGIGFGKGAPAETVVMTGAVRSTQRPFVFLTRASLTRAASIGYPSQGDKFRDRSRSRSPVRNGTKTARSRSPPPRGGFKIDRRPERREPRARGDGRGPNGSSGPGHLNHEMDVDFKEDADEGEMDEMMRRSMGFSRFRTTKNTKVPGNDIYGVRKEKKSEYRQYMNRTGGFNRPLSPSRS
ncbi:uncharacterized protein N7477_004621 [Penicillium maclennaniae]|uniref:uncharacterized protein n=1 Tax=Penicillium maclennaniae TaxID=1343394 RepID=UPI0025422CCB|nr:uncharacterized protein N7477_004621 [Penicillium maclennaniae]KAJ5674687.1 hypothetical protein N7477_004621 [Penicillium maclennaniae]